MQGLNKVTFLRATIQKECNSQNSICQSEEINGLKVFGNTLHLSSSNAQLKFWSFLGCHVKILRKQILSFCHIFMVKTKIKCLTFDNSLRQTSSYPFFEWLCRTRQFGTWNCFIDKIWFLLEWNKKNNWSWVQN